jgi:hypothetical protein
MDPKTDETKTTTQDPLPGKGPASDGKGGSTSSHQTPKTYTETEYQKAVSDALARAGRDAKSIETREARLKDIETREAALKAREDEAKKKAEEAELEAVKDDPEKLSAFQLRKKAREEMEAAKAEREKVAQERAALQEDMTFAQKVKRSTLMGEIAGEFKDGDPEDLEKLCDSLGIGSEPDRIRTAAGIKWTKLEGSEKKDDDFKPDSGVTKGGAENLDDKSPRELARMGYARKK